ncbi:MAG TPA: bifunctional 4-hydroxy-3-methylbut-2-enyl diphosphate reductase/30S ribosomal protein S1 [Candidatus Fimivivens faecavium]|nr:bifunctional 4-hydroxy-3-methylbut-2-enyl diphosphate reductase/30S ribosomal protein S1 [Candidatus Fimivivens faecavium]
MPKITLAESAGFCFGVKRAVDMVYAALDAGERVCTLGPIIHNPQMVAELEQKGVTILGSIAQVPKGAKVILRSHGVPRTVTDELERLGISYGDATCPFVAKIHGIVARASPDELVLILGDANHPEVQGIVGHCSGRILVISGYEEAKNLKNEGENSNNSCFVVAQTTFNRFEWEKCVSIIKKVYTSAQIFDTICNATSFRQQEAAKLARCCDIMLVVGGRHSSNTAKLCSICGEFCQTILVETADELNPQDFAGASSIGITAGASTPVRIIKEVHETMNEMMENQEELSFEEMLEQSFKSTYNGEKVTAVVTSIAPNEIAVDIGTKHAGYVPLSELTDDPSAKPEDLVKKGDKLDLLVVRVNDQEGTVMLSKKRLDAMAGFEKVMDAVDTGEVLEGVVTEVIKGGVLALTNGVKVFIPASQATMSRNEPLEGLLRKKVEFKILEVNRQRRRAVGSIRAVVRERRKELEEKFWSEVEIGRHYQGTVKSLTDYGAFVDLGGVDGMIHISELSWGKIRHPSQVVKVGDEIEVTIKDIDAEKKKISLGYKKDEDNPWEILKKSYEVGQNAHVKIVSLTAFGAFAELIPGIDGLIHISQISTERVGKPSDVLSVGQEVDVKITEIDYERRRISLSIKALLEEQGVGEAQGGEAPSAE